MAQGHHRVPKSGVSTTEEGSGRHDRRRVQGHGASPEVCRLRAGGGPETSVPSHELAGDTPAPGASRGRAAAAA